MAILPHMVPAQHTMVLMEAVGEEEQETEIDETADDAPHDVRHQQALHPVFDVWDRLTNQPFIEIACLEEEERHEEERPSHDLCEPILVALTTRTHYVQENHAEDTKSAEEVKSMVPLLHGSLLLSL